MRPVVSEFMRPKRAIWLLNPQPVADLKQRGIEYNMRTNKKTTQERDRGFAEEARALSRAAGRVGR